ncbi:Zn(2)-C6 fungal-type domain-containing protein [Fusarium keratoplasticum]|uniref:Zn(2)-C6 fungal-type domain-containing protein n=1 Tax=Fusarium keratoplasticum TaxID=1328300 RepID=A0ACC0RHQ2_9HYPO|nr:Zn(2)-C6 fungal-type domain-containing protein [Fusarium keratoplasticum]KAI8685177.1 Zn(2)-C6 fungal-type domain-containing protein [Fusarium keratoplasticum]KAI8689295.1 Zn(2)-C6 fungal-type domain-containing protein [Fusarium keratoplasticum]
MRTTIACERCRRSKVKCRHDGQPPCAGCAKSGHVRTCALSGPILGQKPSSDSRPRSAKRRRLSPGSPAEESSRDIGHVFSHVPRDRLIKAITIFRAQFPEFGFIHPGDLEYHEGELGVLQKLRLLAILVVSHRYMDDDPIDEPNVSYITNEAQKRMTNGPSLALIQTFLILSLCNWGDGDGFNAWMHSGIATRMAQGLLSTGFAGCSKGETLSEIEKRTLWTCFKMDKLLSCGKRRQAMFPDQDLHFSLPINDAQFLFGAQATPAPTLSPGQTDSRIYGPDDYLVLLIQGLRIWSRVHTWIAEGGRRQPGMTEPAECPWNETSKWHQMKQGLIKWRESQDALIRYPGTKVSMHAQRGQAERFGYINLIYYVSFLFLCREYIPFCPVDEVKPRGPIEPPLLKAPGPEAFWSQNLIELYNAATQMSNLLGDLEHVGCSLRTPFSGLCAFSSTLWSLYAASFPKFMGFTQEQTKNAEEQAERTMAYLVRIGQIWKLADEWIDVLNTAKSLFHRVTMEGHGRTVKRSRYDYPELEESIHLAPLKGMPRQTFDSSSLVSSSVNPPSERSTQQTTMNEAGEEENAGGGIAFQDDLAHGNDFLGEDWWRLLSFYDDPHLLSTSIDNIGDANAD